MAVTAGTITLVKKAQSTASLVCTAAASGVGPYTYQWYRSDEDTFTPGAGNLISGATALTLDESGLTPGKTYYYQVVATDTGDSNATDASAEFTLTTVPGQVANQFGMSSTVGMLDVRINPAVISVQVHSSQATPMLAGQAVKLVDEAGGVPKVVACAADTDAVIGFLCYNNKDASFVAGAAAEIALAGSIQFLTSCGAIGRGAKVKLNLTALGGVEAVAGSGNETIVGWAFDKASAADQLIRVMLLTPSFAVDA